jgi:hypothetical protein
LKGIVGYNVMEFVSRKPYDFDGEVLDRRRIIDVGRVLGRKLLVTGTGNIVCLPDVETLDFLALDLLNW